MFRPGDFLLRDTYAPSCVRHELHYPMSQHYSPIIGSNKRRIVCLTAMILKVPNFLTVHSPRCDKLHSVHWLPRGF